MNSYTHNQTSDNSSISNHSIPPSIRLVLHLPSPVYNPTTADFERLAIHTILFLSFRPTTTLPKIFILKIYNR